MKPLLDLAGMTRETRRLVLLGGISASVAALSSILLLAVSGWFLTGAAIAGVAGPAAVLGFNYLIPSASIRLLAILRTVSRYGERIWSHQGALLGMAELRGRLFARLSAQDSRNAPDMSGGDASARLIGDIQALEDLVVRRPARQASVVAAIAGLVLTAMAGWLPAVLLALMLAALPFLLREMARRLTDRPAHDAAEALGELRIRYVDFAGARSEIAAYGLADRVTAELFPIAARLDAAHARLFRAEAAMAGFLLGYGALAVAAVLVTSTAEAPILALALLAASAAIEAMGSFARSVFRGATVREGLRRIAALQELADAPVQGAARKEAATLKFGDMVLEPGARLAITGISGSGKTMVLEALAGMRALQVPVELDGQLLALCSADALCMQFALSPQDAPMLAGTIADNLRLARPGVDDDAMWRALEVAQLADRISRAPEKLETRLGEAGGILSGGERKRLSLARAILAGRPWLLLDEPTEGLDPETEQALIAALGRWLDETGTGLILVSHRRHPLSLTRRALEIGKLVRL